jgi:hypothetical protein
VEHEAGRGGGTAEEMGAHVLHDFGGLSATEPAQEGLGGTAEVIDVSRQDCFFGSSQQDFPVFSSAATIEDLTGASLGSGSKILGAEQVGPVPLLVCRIEELDFSAVLLGLLLRGQDLKWPVSVLRGIHN